MLDFLTEITREEANMIEDVLHWTQENKAAFLLAKQIFEMVD